MAVPTTNRGRDRAVRHPLTRPDVTRSNQIGPDLIGGRRVRDGANCQARSEVRVFERGRELAATPKDTADIGVNVAGNQ
jgi:hypothetical protein